MEAWWANLHEVREVGMAWRIFGVGSGALLGKQEKAATMPAKTPLFSVTEHEKRA